MNVLSLEEGRLKFSGVRFNDKPIHGRKFRLRLPWINRKYVQKKAAGMTEKDVGTVVEKAKTIRGRFQHVGPLGKYLQDVELLISIVKDYWTGEYRDIPWWALSAIVFALLYVISPVDLIPDFIPVIGYLDDAAVVSICLKLVEQELHTYKAWKERQK